MPKILIDGDGCPVIKETIEIARAYEVEVVIVCDTSHFFSYEDVEVIVVDKGKDVADFTLLRNTKNNDIIITQDYGLAALALAKGAIVLSQNGFAYTKDNIDTLLAQRHQSSKQRKHGHYAHAKKRTAQVDDAFCELLEDVLSSIER